MPDDSIIEMCQVVDLQLYHLVHDQCGSFVRLEYCVGVSMNMNESGVRKLPVDFSEVREPVAVGRCLVDDQPARVRFVEPAVEL